MATEFFIPKLEQTDEVTIVNWLVDDGVEVKEGDDIVEVETDKAVVPVPANASGVLHIGQYQAGDVVPTETVIATIDGEGEAGSPAEAEETAEAVQAEAAPAAEPAAAKAETKEAVAHGPRATPVAQKMAADLGVDLNAINGSGEHGKVTKADVLKVSAGEKEAEKPAEPAPKTEAPPKDKPAPQPAARPAADAPTAQPASFASPTAEEDVLERVPLKSIRGVIARRMAESVHTTARVTLMSEVDATELVDLREQLKARFTEPWGFAPGYNDLLALIVANALRQFPYMNARLAADGESIEYLNPVNMGMAVDTDRGLPVPVMKDADKLGLQQFGSKFRELVKRARSGKSNLDDLSGGTFTITSLGINRVDAFTPVINLPEAAILGIGRIKEKPVVKDGQIVARKMMTLSLVFDHRLTDGAPAANFLDYICELIEEPYLLFLTKR